MADYPTGVPSFLEPKNFVKVDTASAISASDTTIPLVDASALPTGGGYLVADNESLEIIQYTGVSGNNLTGVTRGTDDSSPSSQPASTNLEMRWNAAYLNQSHTNIVAIAQDLYNCFSADLDDAASVGAVANNMEDRLDMIATQIKAIISGVDWKDSPTVTLNALDTEVSGKVAKGGDTMTGQLIMDNQVGIKLVDSGGTNGVTLNAPATLGGDYTILLPTAQSSGVRLLENDGSGNLAWRSLTNYITDAMINSSAAITLTKLATLTADRMVITNGSGYLSVAAITPGYMLISDANQIPSASGWAYSSGNLLTSAQGELRLADSGGTNYIGIEANASTTSYTIVFPAAQGAVDSVLKNDGAGNLTWAALGAGTGTVEPGLQYEIPFYNQAGTGNVVNGSTSIMTNATGQLIVADGAVGTPSISFINDTDTGIYGGSGWIRFSSGGSQTAYMGNGWFYNSDGTAAAPSYSFINDIDTGIFSAGANLIGFASNGNERMRLTTNDVEFYGNPGVTVSHATEATLDLRETTNTITIRMRATNAGSYIGTDTSDSFKIVTGNVDRLTFGASGDATFATDVLLQNGSAANPALAFSSATASGFYYGGGTAFGVTQNGTAVLYFHTTSYITQYVPTRNLSGGDGAPSYSFTASPNTGMYYGGSNNIAFSANGSTKWRVDSGGAFAIDSTDNTIGRVLAGAGTSGSPAYSFNVGGGSTMGMYQVSTSELAFSVGGNRKWRITSTQCMNSNNGTVSAPAYSFTSHSSTGFWAASNEMTASVSSSNRMAWTNGDTLSYANFRSNSDNTHTCGSASQRWSDVRSVLINGADYGFANGWIIREYPCTPEDVQTKSNDWMKENAYKGIQFLNKEGIQVCRMEDDGILRAKGFKTFEGISVEEKIKSLEEEIKQLKEAA